jgi:hypothetical protein
MGRSVALAGFLFGLAAVLLQFSLTMPASMAAGRSLAGSLAFFFTFFTILTNILVVLVYAGAAFGGRLAWFAQPRLATGAAVAIAVVGIVYATVLARLWNPQGLHLVANVMLHYIAPPLFLVWWASFGRDGSSRLADVPKWLIYPLVYLGVVLARGAVVHEYPYPFLDPAPNGAASVAIACTAIFALFVVIAAVLVIADRSLAPRR